MQFERINVAVMFNRKERWRKYNSSEVGKVWALWGHSFLVTVTFSHQGYFSFRLLFLRHVFLFRFLRPMSIFLYLHWWRLSGDLSLIICPFPCSHWLFIFFLRFLLFRCLLPLLSLMSLSFLFSYYQAFVSVVSELIDEGIKIIMIIIITIIAIVIIIRIIIIIKQNCHKRTTKS